MLCLATQVGAAAPLAFVTNQSANTVSVIDLATRATVRTIGVGQAPAGIAFDRQRRYAFVTAPAAHAVTVIDVAEERRAVVEALGASFVSAAAWGVAWGQTHGSDPSRDPASASSADVVFHTSVSAAGLATAIACAGLEATIVELSWYGDRDVPVRLGGAFHSQRLKLISSQVGHVSAGRRPRWDYRRRLNAALRLLNDARLDALVAEEIAFDDAATALALVLAPGAQGLAPVIRYPGA